MPLQKFGTSPASSPNQPIRKNIFNNRFYRLIYDLIRQNKSLNFLAHKIMQSERIHRIPLYRTLYQKMIQKKAADLLIAPHILEFELTDVCNARCVMCPPEVHLGKDFIDHDLFERVAREGYAMGIRRMILTGGEPLLDKRIFDKIKYAKGLGYEYVHMFSNGSLLNEINRDKLLSSGLDSFTMSVDSAVKEEYEKIRVRLKFDTVVTNMRELYKLKLERKLKKPLIRVNMVALRENQNSRQLFLDTFAQASDIVEIMDSHNWAEAITTDGSGNAYSQSTRYPCHLLFLKAVVGPQGHLKKCSIDMSKAAYMVDLKQVSLKEALMNEKIQSLKQRMLNYTFSEPGCMNCTHKESWWVDC